MQGGRENNIDIEKAFAHAKIYTLDELAQHKTEVAITAAGKRRYEDKGYVMQGGDIVHFL